MRRHAEKDAADREPLWAELLSGVDSASAGPAFVNGAHGALETMRGDAPFFEKMAGHRWAWRVLSHAWDELAAAEAWRDITLPAGDLSSEIERARLVGAAQEGRAAAREAADGAAPSGRHLRRL
jgi:hypothetical protein